MCNVRRTQVCVSVRAVKYLYKYVLKGSDRAMMAVDVSSSRTTAEPAAEGTSSPPGANDEAASATDEPVNEIKRFLDTRVIGSSEGKEPI